MNICIPFIPVGVFESKTWQPGTPPLEHLTKDQHVYYKNTIAEGDVPAHVEIGINTINSPFPPLHMYGNGQSKFSFVSFSERYLLVAEMSADPLSYTMQVWLINATTDRLSKRLLFDARQEKLAEPVVSVSQLDTATGCNAVFLIYAVDECNRPQHIQFYRSDNGQPLGNEVSNGLFGSPTPLIHYDDGWFVVGGTNHFHVPRGIPELVQVGDDFPPVHIDSNGRGTRSRCTFKIVNNDSSCTVITGIVLPNDPHFHIVSPVTLPKYITQGHHLTLIIEFDPRSAPGAYSETITVKLEGSDGPELLIECKASAVRVP